MKKYVHIIKLMNVVQATVERCSILTLHRTMPGLSDLTQGKISPIYISFFFSIG